MRPLNIEAQVFYMNKWRDCIILHQRELFSIVRIKDKKEFTDNIINAKPDQVREKNGSP